MSRNYVSGTFAADGDSTSILVKERATLFVGGDGGLDFGGGDVTAEVKGPDGQWYSLGDVMTTRDVKGLELLMPGEIRLSLSGATDPDLDYSILSDTESYRD